MNNDTILNVLSKADAMDVFIPNMDLVNEMNQRFIQNALPLVVSARELLEYDNQTLRAFMQHNGLYVYPTIQLIEWLDLNIPDLKDTLEIGSGNGVIARILQVQATDSMMQSDRFKPKNNKERMWHNEAMKSYKSLNHPFVPYGLNVEQIEAKEALRKYKPTCVFGCYITHKWVHGDTDGNVLGIDEEWILNRNYLQKYIMVGNLKVHQNKRILKRKHTAIELDGLVVRTSNPELNRIFIWEK